MAKRDARFIADEGLVHAVLSLTLVLFGCGRTSLDLQPGDAGPAGPGDASGGRKGASDAAVATGGTQAMSGTTSRVMGAGSAAGLATGGISVTGGASAFGGTKTGGATTGLTSTGGRGGMGTGGTVRTGGILTTGGTTRAGGTGGRGGGSATAFITAGRTGTAGTSGPAGTTATGGRGGAGGTSTQTTTGGTGGGTVGTGGTGSSTAAALFQPLADAFCTAAKSCCPRSPATTANLSDCESKFLSRLDNYSLVDKGTVLVDEKALADCTSAYKAAATGCTINPVKAACKGVFVGLQAEGKTCGGTSPFGAVECKPVDGSSTCYRPQGNTDPKSIGTCVRIPRGKSGDACSTTCQKGETCMVDMLGGSAPFPATCFEEDGLFCSMASNPTVCKPILKNGDACKWEGNSCGSGNYCSWPNSTCAPASKLGEPCPDPACADDLVCGDSLKCVELLLASESVCQGIPSTP